MANPVYEWRVDDPLVVAAVACKHCTKDRSVWCVSAEGRRTPGLHSVRRNDYKKAVEGVQSDSLSVS